MIEIWQPRYKDNTVLIATYKVENGFNQIRFTKARHLANMIFEVNSDVIRSCPVESNGKISCFAVPMSKLQRV